MYKILSVDSDTSSVLLTTWRERPDRTMGMISADQYVTSLRTYNYLLSSGFTFRCGLFLRACDLIHMGRRHGCALCLVAILHYS